MGPQVPVSSTPRCGTRSSARRADSASTSVVSEPSRPRGSWGRLSGSAAPMIRGCRLRCSPRSCSRRPDARRPSRARDCPRRLDTTLDPGHRLTLGLGAGRVREDHRAQRLGRPPGCSDDARTSAPRGCPSTTADNDLARLLSHLVASLAAPASTCESAAVLDHLPGDATAALTALVNAVARAGEHEPEAQWVLVLDDYHVLTAPEVHEAVCLPARPRSRPAAPGDRHPRRPALSRWRGCAAAGSSSRCAAPTCASPPARRSSSSTRRWAWTSTPPTSTPSRSAPRAGSPACSSPRCRCGRSRPGPRSPTSSRRSPAATGSSSTTWPTRSWPGNRPRCATSCCELRSSTGSPAPLCDAVSGQTGGARDARGPRARQPVRRPAGRRALLVPLPPPVRRRAARTAARPRTPTWSRSCTGGPATGTPRTGLRRGRRPARPGRRGLHTGRLPGGGSAARGPSRATGQPAAHAGSGRCRTRSSAGARC